MISPLQEWWPMGYHPLQTLGHWRKPKSAHWPTAGKTKIHWQKGCLMSLKIDSGLIWRGPYKNSQNDEHLCSCFFLIRPYIQSFVHARIRAFLHSCILTFLHSYIHAFIHTYVHSFIYIYIYIYIYLCFLLRSQSLMVFVQVCGLVGFLGSHAYSHTSHATYIRNAFGYTWKWDILSNGHFNGDNDG